MPEAKEGDDYEARIRVTGGESPYTWAIVSGTLPSGLILESDTDYILGTPARGTAGIRSFTVGVTDSSTPAIFGQRSFSITIEKGPYESIITIDSSLLAGHTKVFVGGKEVAVLQRGDSARLSFEPGTSNTITVDPVVSHPAEDNVRFKPEVDRILVSEFSPDAHFSFYAEYFIEFTTEPSQVAQLTGSGWYKEGYSLRTSTLTEVEGTPGTQYRFSYWLLPTGETANDDNLSLTVSMPGSIIANYDTYYELTLTSPYGEPGGSTWYKAGSEIEWGIVTHEVPMSGILGFFKGKLKAVNYSGTEIMDAPKAITITWEPDYTMPAILIPLSFLLLGLIIFGLYRLARGPRLGPVPVAPPPQPLPSPQTTVVVMGGETPKQLPQTTREQLLEKFGELLQKYEQEIKTSIETEEVGKVEAAEEEKMLSAPEQSPSTVVEGEVTSEEEGTLCNFTAKRLLRMVTSKWRQVETRTIALPPTGKKKSTSGTGFAVVWARDVYNEWEILTCSLPREHTGTHQGSLKTVYNLLNTVTEEKVYGPKHKQMPPMPHFTDGMPELEISTDQVIPPEQLPTEVLS